MSRDGAPRIGRVFARYTAARFGLFVAVGAVGYAAGLRNLLFLLVLALLVSGVLSYFLLTRARVSFSEAVARRWQHRSRHPIADRRAREEAYADAFHAEGRQQP
jgi:hypothetical protein